LGRPARPYQVLFVPTPPAATGFTAVVGTVGGGGGDGISGGVVGGGGGGGGDGSGFCGIV
jgi:hypothetical protein